MQVNELKKEFEKFYGDGECHVYFSPGRVNLIGEHTDYNGGFVFPCALSFGTYCILRKTNNDYFQLRSLNQKKSYKLRLDELSKPMEKGNWANYVLGVIAQFAKDELFPDSGADILFWGNVPNGAGLSSSASLEVVTGVAINQEYRFGKDQLSIVKYSQKAEHEFAGVMCGIMDQFASGMGKKDHAIYLNCDKLEYELVPIKLEGVKIVIGNTNSPHSLDESKYNERVAECQAAVKAINPSRKIANLGELCLTEFNSLENTIEDELIRKRARHVVSEIERTQKAVEELKKGNLFEFGQLMNKSHDSLRDDYEVTGRELDCMVNAARKIEGTIGSRMTGGGFGGSTVNLVKDEFVEEFIEKVGKEYTQNTGIVGEFYVAEIGDGGKRIE
ncbi:galactokinase [Marinifilum caeruleilacunae]|uniref:Galactokinase n=1 Tax=Marinifilum caeruleilacunae TaxID=2499076 RepID=A0ABX1WXL5_9BACT|nr:galactokinase [Marinifilum caeruleilacunae]NOU60851.1 galactokinase [Marinifilum caeruleilacunae]